MTDILPVHFAESQKVYFFKSNGIKAKPGDMVVVETANGPDVAFCSEGNKMIDPASLKSPLKMVLRLASARDKQTIRENEEKNRRAFSICKELIARHKLDMNLSEVRYAFDGSKVTFYFTSDNRVDFRELVRDLARELHSKIELRQVGIRDRAKMIGGIGRCGRPLCCATFMKGFHPVSVKMAKEQGISLAPSVITGCCGRLMCCLNYEQKTYEELNKITPRVGSTVDCDFGRGQVISANVLTGILKVKLDGSIEGSAPVTVNRENCRVVSKAPRKRKK